MRRQSGRGLDIAFFGSSLISAYWNGAATYYRGIIKALSLRGHRVTFFEPDAFERQSHRDMNPPSWARVRVYSATQNSDVLAALEEASASKLVIKCSGVGVFDELLEREALALKREGTAVAFWDVDAPATLARIAANPLDPFSALIPRYDYIFTYGGGDEVVNKYTELGAQRCTPIYNALDPDTHFRVTPQRRFRADLALLANRLPDRENRVEEFFIKVAEHLKSSIFLLGGNGWQDKRLAMNIRYCGHVYTTDHNAFNSSAAAVLNINRESMAECGYSPPTRIFEAAGAAACIISDQWTGIELFLRPGQEILTAANGAQVCDHLRSLTPKRCRDIGDAARRRILAEHTYEERARQFEDALGLDH
jgi:spore maturation protein CgeB